MNSTPAASNADVILSSVSAIAGEPPSILVDPNREPDPGEVAALWFTDGNIYVKRFIERFGGCHVFQRDDTGLRLYLPDRRLSVMQAVVGVARRDDTEQPRMLEAAE